MGLNLKNYLLIVGFLLYISAAETMEEIVIIKHILN